MERAIVIGASSGMGSELAKILSKNGAAVGLAARRADKLQSLAAELPGRTCIKSMDIAQPEEAVKALKEMIDELGGMDLIIISAAVDHFDPDPGATLKWDQTEQVIDINVTGFAAVAGAAYEYFAGRGAGHIAGISSVAGLRGSAEHPAYSASKAFVSNYLEGLRVKAAKAGLDICVTDIRPGNVDTPMSAGQPGRFWVAPAAVAAACIYTAIRRKKHIAYITPRWGIIARLLRVLPGRLYAKL